MPSLATQAASHRFSTVSRSMPPHQAAEAPAFSQRVHRTAQFRSTLHRWSSSLRCIIAPQDLPGYHCRVCHRSGTTTVRLRGRRGGESRQGARCQCLDCQRRKLVLWTVCGYSMYPDALVVTSRTSGTHLHRLGCRERTSGSPGDTSPQTIDFAIYIQPRAVPRG